MRPADILRAILRGEVDGVDRGTHQLASMRERDADLHRERERLRAEAHQSHPLLPEAVARRLRAVTGQGRSGM